MGMKTSAVWADGTFESNTAPLMGPLEDCARRAAELGYDALSLTVNRPGELDAAYVRRVLGEYGLTASGLATGRIYTVDGLGLGLADQERRQAAVDRMLTAAVPRLNPGGRLAVISFHSLEDRIVKNALAAFARGCTCPPDFPVCVCGKTPQVRLVNRKPILSGEAELNENPRARSAKLRLAEKL